MRIDKFLNTVNITKRRTVAKDMLDHDVVYLNGQQVKPSKEVKIGDKISISYLDHTQEFEVLGIPTTKSIPKSSKHLYVKEMGEHGFEGTKAKFEALFEGQMSEDEGREFLKKLYEKGESEEDIRAAVEVMRAHAVALPLDELLREKLVDNCGTGGDKSGTFNISTTVSIILASLGCSVAKHGNRSITSNSGSADMLEALGVRLDLEPEALAVMLQECGFAFLFAQKFHPAMKHIMPIRKSLPHRTIFNLLGPLCNPAGVQKQFIGVYDPQMITKVTKVLAKTGSKKAMVVCGRDGLDEITLADTTYVSYFDGRAINSYELTPQAVGIRPVSLEHVRGGTATDNAKITYDLLKGEITGAKKDIVLLNTAGALVVEGKARDFQEGIALARTAIESGLAFAKLEHIITTSQKL